MTALKLLTIAAITIGTATGLGLGTPTGPAEPLTDTGITLPTVGFDGVRVSIVVDDAVDYSGLGAQPPAIVPGGSGRSLVR